MNCKSININKECKSNIEEGSTELETIINLELQGNKNASETDTNNMT